MGVVTQLLTRKQRLTSDQAREVRQRLLEIPDLPQQPLGMILAALERQTISQTDRSFVQLDPYQNRMVVEWIEANSRRGGVTRRVWAELFTAMRSDTQEVMLSRGDLADRLKARPTHVSTALTELESIRAISRHREPVPGIKGPGRVVIKINSWWATMQYGAARDEALAQDKPLDPTDWSNHIKHELQPIA